MKINNKQMASNQSYNRMFSFRFQQQAILFVFMFLFTLSGTKAQNKFVHKGAGNPYLPLWEHLPDGEPRVFEDPDRPGKFRAYIIGSHDLRVNSYCGPDIRIWSAPVEDLSSWRDEGPVFTYPIDNQWDVMYAPDLVEVKRKNGKKEYYLYPHSRGRNREAMVAKGDRPDGPFTPINLTADGKATVPGSILGFDPAVYVEYITDPKDPDYIAKPGTYTAQLHRRLTDWAPPFVFALFSLLLHIPKL